MTQAFERCGLSLVRHQISEMGDDVTVRASALRTAIAAMMTRDALYCEFNRRLVASRMDDTKIKPALTAEEWEKSLDEKEEAFLDGYVNIPLGVIDVRLGGVGSKSRDVFEDRHKLAALLLYKAPFGFTREDVNALDDAITGVSGDGMDADPLRSIKARVEALLPPQATG